jgi:NRAMP (natural resistance-associated macrophage protein)-like metal ion transporter
MEKQDQATQNDPQSNKLLSLSEFRRELGIPLILVKRLIVWGEIESVRALDGTLKIATSEITVAKKLFGTPYKKARLFLRALGPGIITGASDDDPSGIGTYSAVGATFGLSILWMAVWLLPVMTAIQEACARIGVVTNKGLAGVIKTHYSRKVLLGAVTLLIVANVVNIGADLGAMAAAIGMFSDINSYLIIIGLTIVITLLEIFVQYHLYVKFLKFLAISVLAYVVTGFMIHPDWLEIFKHSFIPTITLSNEYLFAMVAVFGTTITPYLFFWQASEEVEENKLLKHKCNTKKGLCNRISHMRGDVYTGMVLANIVFFFIVLTTAQVLFANGINNINTAADAAKALAPLAGKNAAALFAFGIIGTGLLAIPVLAGSGAYALSEVLSWKEGLEYKFLQAKGFYLIITLSIVFGGLFNFFKINPIAALYWSAFLNGIIAVPLLYLIMKIGDNPEIMGEERHPKWVKFFGWFAVVAMTIAILVMVGMEFI